jgi:hypothetical protein
MGLKRKIKPSVFLQEKAALFDGSDNLCQPGAILPRKDSESSGLGVLFPPLSCSENCVTRKHGYGENPALK